MPTDGDVQGGQDRPDLVHPLLVAEERRRAGGHGPEQRQGVGLRVAALPPVQIFGDLLDTLSRCMPLPLAIGAGATAGALDDGSLNLGAVVQRLAATSWLPPNRMYSHAM
jgi:hypothetical protein